MIGVMSIVMLVLAEPGAQESLSTERLPEYAQQVQFRRNN